MAAQKQFIHCEWEIESILLIIVGKIRNISSDGFQLWYIGTMNRRQYAVNCKSNSIPGKKVNTKNPFQQLQLLFIYFHNVYRHQHVIKNKNVRKKRKSNFNVDTPETGLLLLGLLVRHRLMICCCFLMCTYSHTISLFATLFAFTFMSKNEFVSYSSMNFNMNSPSIFPYFVSIF